MYTTLGTSVQTNGNGARWDSLGGNICRIEVIKIDHKHNQQVYSLYAFRGPAVERMMANCNMFINYLAEDDDITSDSSSEEEEEEESKMIIQTVTAIIPRVITNKRVTIKNFVEEVVVNYTDKTFASHFRMKRALGSHLAHQFSLSPVYINLKKHENSRLNISPEKHILTFLWFAGHQTASYTDVADRFDLSLSSLFEVITRVIDYLNTIAPDVIKLPEEQEKRQIKTHYSTKGFANVVGSIDGSHIKIDRPRVRPTDYFNRKDYHSVILQAVCDHNLKFIDIFVGYPGSVHDARVFRNSPLFEQLQEYCGNDYLLGDSAYPLSPTLITPYRDNGHLTRQQKRFNKVHSCCRVSIEHAFGLLKQRFRQLYHLKLVSPERIAKFITACCVLHNLCQDDGLTFDHEERIEDIQPETEPYIGGNQRQASICRDNLCRAL